MAGIEYLLTDLPRYARITARSEVASSVVSSGAVLIFTEDGQTLTFKNSDGSYTVIGSGGSGSGIDPSSTTAEAGDVLSGKVFYTSGGSLTSGTIPTVSATLSGGVVTVPSGYIAASQTISAGGSGVDPSGTTAEPDKVLSGYTFLTSGGTMTSGTIPTLGSSSYTPGTATQQISAGQYLGGVQTIPGDANLIASNIVSGVSIFGVTGTASGGGPVIPTSGLVFHAPLASSAGSATTGQVLNQPGITYTSSGGIPCAAFNGSAYISFPNDALPAGTSARTVSIWARQESQGSIYIVWHSGGDDDIGIFIDARSGTGHIAAGTADVDISLASLSDYQYWRHVLLRYANGTAEVFVDGALIGTASITLDTVLTGTAYIGCSTPSIYNWNGSIAAVRVYNRALTREEIQILASELHPTT